jgi:immunity protein, SdpI family
MTRTTHLRSEAPHWLLLAANVGIAAYGWATLPDVVPVHWGINGEADRMGGRAELLLLPLASLGTYVLLRVLPRIDPGRDNYAQFGDAYAAIRLLILAGLTAMAAVTVLAAGGAPVNVSRVMGVITGLLVAGLGNLMGKVRPNFFVGIRTPWTLTSKRAWVKTHRVGGWVMTAFGIVMALAAVSGFATVSGVLGAAGGIAVVGLAVYSFLVWRTDPERTSPAGTQPA